MTSKLQKLLGDWRHWIQPIVQLTMLFLVLPEAYRHLRLNNPEMFARQGAMLVAFGIMFTGFAGKDLIKWQIAEALGQVNKQDYRWLSVANWIVIWVMLFGGTLLWGFGDLVVCLYHNSNGGASC